MPNAIRIGDETSHGEWVLSSSVLYKQSMLKKWISHCFYARDEANQPASQFYISLEEELSAYNTAVGGA